MTTETQTQGTAAAASPAASASSPAPASAAPAAPAPAAPASQPEGKSTLLTDDSQPADQKPAEAKPADGEKAEAKPGDKPAEPVDYTDFTTPEGVTLNADALTELKAFAKEKGLTQEEAQKLVDLGVKTQQANQQAIATQIEQAVAQWAEQSRTDAEFGGDKLAESRALAKKALDTFGTPALTEMLRTSGLGNHPEIIRAFYRAGQAISEDRLVTGSIRPNKGKTVEQSLYVNSNMNP